MEEKKYHKNSIEKDEEKFVDFNLLDQAQGFDGKSAIKTITDYMGFSLSEFSHGYTTKVAANFSEFSEKRYYPTLGYSKRLGRGRGVKVKSFLEILNILAIRDKASDIMVGNMFAPVFVENYGPDRNSDFLIKLIIPQLSDYTKSVAQENGLETKVEKSKKWDISKHDWVPNNIVLAKFPNELEYRLIVPEEILTTKLPYDANDFIYRYWLTLLNERRKENGLKPYTQKDLREKEVSKYDSNHDYILSVLRQMSDEYLLGYMPRFKQSSINNSKKKNKHKRNKSKKHKK